MGSSYFPIQNNYYDAYCRGLQLLNVQSETTDVNKTTIHVDNVNLYKVIDIPHAKPGTFQHFVYYGGPGELA
ncbi:hypothetical protein H5410_043750 [Solanum commersonii]|uniref:Neprosin PEP catalytic domain-containing protein n=1 Tax=Solanum commersonii TaxID=4109 RepID=A0A9J5Y1N2_SOLCO|nr:hypothetical protein H5410_043750 [Solanum commersonii]